MQSTPSDQPRILIVGFTRAYRLELAGAFRDQGFDVYLHETAELATLVLDRQHPDAVVLDWAAKPPLTAFEFVERYAGLLPVLILSRQAPLFDVVRALRAGAADFIRLPCYVPEILARVERAQADAPTSRKLVLGALSLDVETAVARIGEQPVRMTAREARMLSALLRCPERPVSREALMRVAGITGAKATIVESYMKQLRKRHPLLRRAVRTKYGRGYAYCPEP